MNKSLKYLSIVLTVGILLSSVACAQPNVVLTPTTLFDMIEKQGEKIEKLVSIATRNNIRVQALESKLQNLDEELSAEVDALGKSFKKANMENIELGINPLDAEVRTLREQIKKLDSKIIKQTKKITELESKLVQEHLRVSDLFGEKKK